MIIFKICLLKLFISLLSPILLKPLITLLRFNLFNNSLELYLLTLSHTHTYSHSFPIEYKTRSLCSYYLNFKDTVYNYIETRIPPRRVLILIIFNLKITHTYIFNINSISKSQSEIYRDKFFSII